MLLLIRPPTRADTLKELWLLTLLPNRKLLTLAQRPLATAGGSGLNKRKKLLTWAFEHELKQRYELFVTKVLKNMLTDPIEQIKSKALGGLPPWVVLCCLAFSPCAWSCPGLSCLALCCFSYAPSCLVSTLPCLVFTPHSRRVCARMQ